MPDSHHTTIFLTAAFLTGLAMGSFVSVASYRLPRGEEIVFKPSHCPHCGAMLAVRELFPLLSWLIQRGRCLHCAAPIGIRYPLIELAMGIAFFALALAFGLTFKTLILALLVTEFAILIVTDLEHTIIPDGVQIALFFTGIAWCILRDANWEDVIISATTGLFLGLLLHYGYKLLRKKDGLGWADVKFLCIAGVWLPLAAFPSFLFFAGVIGTLTGISWRLLKRGPLFPFGPALAVSLFINILWPNLFQHLMP